MRQMAPRLLITLMCFSLVTAYLPATTLAAERRAYFKTYGADVMSGGWFNYKDSPCNTTDNPMPNPDPPPADPANLAANFQDGKNDRLAGGIMAYTRSTPVAPHFDAVGGSSSQFAAYVLGVVEGNNANNFGFYTNGANGGPVTGRTFSNKTDPTATVTATQWGGLFQDDDYNGKRYSYCMPDYFSKKPANYVAMPTVGGPGIPYGRLVNGTASGIYYVDGTAAPYKITHNAAINLNTGAPSNITIYVNGDAYIDQNITFNAAASVNDLPKFAVVAKGSIYISKDVTELYGFYIAQPDPANVSAVTDDDGIIWTCHENSTARPLYTWVANNCDDNKLTITGAFAAKQVNFLRIGDATSDVGSATTADDNVATAINSGNRRIAEVINYHPAMAMNGPFFTLTTTEASRTPIDSLISLPPIF